MSINKKTGIVVAALAISGVVFLTGCNFTPKDIVSSTEDEPAMEAKLPKDLEGVKAFYQSALDCTPDRIQKNQNSTCTGSLPGSWQTVITENGHTYKINWKVAKNYSLRIPNEVSIVSKNIKMGKSAKIVVKAKQNNTWVGEVRYQAGNVKSPVLVNQEGKISSWKKIK